MMENVLSFLRAAAPWISMGLLIAFLCVRPAIRKGKAEDDYAEEGMCVGMCLGLMLGSLSDSSNSGLGASLGMLFGLVIGLCMHKKETEDRGNEKKSLSPSARSADGFPVPVGLGRRKCKAYILTVQSGNIAALEE